MAGVVGGDIEHLSWRRLWRRYWGKVKDQWNHTAALIATIENFSFSPPRTPVQLADRHPVLRMQRQDDERAVEAAWRVMDRMADER